MLLYCVENQLSTNVKHLDIQISYMKNKG